MSSFGMHHVAISSRNLDRTADFYAHLGFRLVAKWSAKDGSLNIAHFQQDQGAVALEVFNYAVNESESALTGSIGNDLSSIGVKHFGVNVQDLEATRQALVSAGLDDITEIVHGRLQIDYFFLKDPDGMWVEVLEERRTLDPSNPMILVEE